MAFMQGEYTLDTFFRVERPNGEAELYCEWTDVYRTIGDEIDNGETWSITALSGYWGRLSAPGYLDVTDWLGPFESETEAKEAIRDQYNVDPDTGDELSEGN